MGRIFRTTSETSSTLGLMHSKDDILSNPEYIDIKLTFIITELLFNLRLNDNIIYQNITDNNITLIKLKDMYRDLMEKRNQLISELLKRDDVIDFDMLEGIIYRIDGTTFKVNLVDFKNNIVEVLYFNPEKDRFEKFIKSLEQLTTECLIRLSNFRRKHITFGDYKFR